MLRQTSTYHTHPLVISIATAAAAIATTYLLTKPLLSKYGLSGTLRLIWEGDHLPPHIRECVDELQDIEIKLKKEKRTINRIKVVIETAKLNSVDDDDGNNPLDPHDQGNSSSREIRVGEVVGDDGNKLDSSIKQHYILCQVPSLSKDLGSLSYNLDKLAAQVDGVASHGDTDVKTMKKELSSKIVDMMTICDEFIKECGIE